MNFPSFSLSGNFNPGLSVENPSTEVQQKSQGGHEELKSSNNEQKISHQAAQDQLNQKNLDEMNQNGSQLEPRVRIGSAFPNKNGIQLNDHERRSILDEIFEEAKKSQGNSNALYKYCQNQQEERNLIKKSIQEALSHQAKASSSLEERNLITFKYLDFDIDNYTITEILGAGAHGLVIKMKKGKEKEDLVFNDIVMNDVIIKLYSKENKEAEKAFLDEAVILSVSQKAKQHSLHLDPDEKNYRWDHFQNECFQTEKYYGLFIKTGLGSLWDFKNYLKKTNKELNEQELFMFTWSLLDAVYCLHEADICHRDIKPGNIVINPGTFFPELIDYSFASEMSKAERNPGTEGYRMEDFKVENKEIERRDQLISRDYFALGITILNLMFPDDIIRTPKNINDRLGKLAKFKNIRKKILAETLKACIFGDAEIKKDILKEYIKNYFETDFWQVEDENQKEKLEEIQQNFSPWKLGEYAEKLKRKHYAEFRKYLAEKWSQSEYNDESEVQKYTSSLAQEIQIRENFKENPVRILEQRLFHDEERYIRNNFIEEPEKTLEKCFEIIHHLMMTDHQTFDTKFYSTLMIVLFSNYFLDDAIALGERLIHFHGPEIQDGIFLNNLAFLKRQRNFRDYPPSFFNEYEADSLRLIEEFQDSFIEDLTKLCRCAYDKIQASIWTQEHIQDLEFEKKELALADFEMKLKHQKFFIYMNFCFLRAAQMELFIDEQTRDKIKEFVYGVNISERQEILDMLQLNSNISFLMTLLSFCEIFKDFTRIDELPQLKNGIQAIIETKKVIAQVFQEIGGAERMWSCLLKEVGLLIHYMIGFIILYNLKYDLITKFDAHKWVSSEEGARLKGILSNEEFNRHISELQAEQDKKWSRQRFLDSIFVFLRGTNEGRIEIPLVFEENDGDDISRLSILDKELDSIFLPYPACKNSHHLLIDFEQNSISVSAVQLTFRLSRDNLETFHSFFANLDKQSVQSIERLRLEFCDYEEGFSNAPLDEISNRIGHLRLKELKIKMEENIRITDRGFRPILKMISTQRQLNHLSLQFNMCFITSKAIGSLAKNLRGHEELQGITLIFKNCSKIESESFRHFLNTVDRLPQLGFVNLHFAACVGVKSFVKPKGLRLKSSIKIDLGETLEESWMNDDGWESDLLFGDIEEFDDSWETEGDEDCENDENEDWGDCGNNE